MRDELKNEGETYNITGPGAGGTVKRSPESWQFFAFMYAAWVTLAFGVIDEFEGAGLRLVLKILSFFALAYIIFVNRRFIDWQVRLLGRWKEKHYS